MELFGDFVFQLDVGVECGEIMVNEILNVVIFVVVLILKEKKNDICVFY